MYGKKKKKKYLAQRDTNVNVYVAYADAGIRIIN